MKHIKTDRELIRIAKRIDSHLDAIRNLVEDLKEAEHSGANTFLQDLDSNCLTAFAWAEHIVHDALVHPELWETGSYGIRYKAPSVPESKLPTITTVE